MELFVATGNAHKLTELGPAFPGHVLRTPADAGLRGFDVDEDGSTFLENALKKARSLHRLIGRPSIADDSGLVVTALGGEPGIYSARYGSPDGGQSKLSAAERNAYLLARMEAHEDRSCAFVCCLVLMLSEDRFFVVQETCSGELLRAPRGEGGFGYDPVVYLPALGRTVAELGVEEKNRLSHRGRAAARRCGILAELEASP
ncbi:MAG TPA: non-canonical purine NTP pyrophosphatase [Rectinemataceae bacterium]|nr:non-canonical purine NTP pyrophosphatase [Rectinemataceae bacterium]